MLKVSVSFLLSPQEYVVHTCFSVNKKKKNCLKVLNFSIKAVQRDNTVSETDQVLVSEAVH